MKHLAPRWARTVLRWVAPPDSAEDVIGDVNEVHARRVERHGRASAWVMTGVESIVLVVALAWCSWRERELGAGVESVGGLRRWVTWSEVRLGLRLMRKQPLMAGTAIMALATGIGLATLGFTLLDGTVFSSLPVEGGDRYVIMRSYSPSGSWGGLESARYRTLARGASGLEYLGAFRSDQFNLFYASGEVEPETGAAVSPSAFSRLGTVPLVGRTLIVADAEPGASPVVLIGEGLWRTRFQASDAVVGSTLGVDGTDRTIVGVMPDAFGFPNSAHVWVPLSVESGDEDGLGGVRPFGILSEGAPLKATQAEMTVLNAQYESATPGVSERRIEVVPYTQGFGSEGFALFMAIMVVVLVMVLLVVAANVANLVLARTLARSGELAVRTALGANRSRLIGQLFVEVLLLGGVAAVIGVTASQAVLRWLEVTVQELPYWIDLYPSVRTITFVVGVTVLASAVGGILPALKATRRDPALALQSGGRGAGGTGLGPFGSSMIVVEMAISVALLAGALALARGFLLQTRSDIDLPYEEVLTARIYVPPPVGDEDAAVEAWMAALPANRDAVVQALGEIPGVLSVGATNQLPKMDASTRRVVVEPIDGAPELEAQLAPTVGVGPGYMESIGAEAHTGRLLRVEDFLDGAAAVVVVNDRFVEKFFGGRSPLGRRVRTVRQADPSAPTTWREVVGVVPDLGISVGDPALAAGFYLPMDALETSNAYSLALRTREGPMRLVQPLLATVAKVDATLRVDDVVPLARVGWETRAFLSAVGGSLTALGSMALMLSVVGIYAIMSFTVTLRTREIGIRIALGAVRHQLLWSIVGRASLMLAIGGAIGGGLALGLLQAKTLVPFRLPETELWILPAVIAVLALSGVAACWIPARRALRVRPVEALRFD